MKDRVKLLNIEVDNLSTKELLTNLEQGVIITPNVDHLIKLQYDKEFYDIYKKAEYVVLDSKILFHALKYLGTPVKEVIAGSDFFPAFCKHHKNNEAITVFLLGAGPGVAKKAMTNINKKSGRQIVVGYYSPPFGFEKNAVECKKILNLINDSGANVLAVGLGAPKQEKWIFKYKSGLKNIKIFMAIGATIDFEANHIRRAPLIFRKTSMEWLYRLLAEPVRLWRRYLIEDLPIFKLIWSQKTGKYSDPFIN